MKTNERNSRRVFGQNFLIDSNVIEAIASDIQNTGCQGIIEIGPGQGAITKNLLQFCDDITVIEKDPKWVSYLSEKAVFKDVKVIKGDASLIDTSLLQSTTPPNKKLVVGNLPYNMAGPILRKWLPLINQYQGMYFMVQYEVAKRMVAKPCTKTYGSLTLFIQNYSRPTLCQVIRPDAFRPKPNVNSATVMFSPLENPVESDPEFFNFLHQCFSQKRKKLTNTLRSRFPKTEVLAGLEKLGLGENSRPEELTLSEYLGLYKYFGVKLKKANPD